MMSSSLGNVVTLIGCSCNMRSQSLLISWLLSFGYNLNLNSEIVEIGWELDP